ncbi:hypothetical protein [Nevskia sp.]|uniref:hypothetical protein n=1 Tax=Nevskia sp. TaxID=1929292 RepID=UPI0025E48BD7|nr:hypothetical protein [Nevskia sp.]
MTVVEARAVVVDHQRWRRGLENGVPQDPTRIGEAIDVLLQATADEAAATALVASRQRMPPHCETCACEIEDDPC